MGSAPAISKTFGKLVLIFILALLVIPSIIGIFVTKSWLGFFIILFVECIGFAIAFTVYDKIRESR